MKNKFAISVFFIFLIPAYACCQSIDRVKAHFLEGDYAAAISAAEKLISGDKAGMSADELYFILGLSYLKEGNYLRASDIFEIILKEFEGSRFKEEALLCLADTYFLRQDFTKADYYYRQLLKVSPSSKFKPLIYSRLSSAGFKKGDTAQGNDYLAKLKQEFPATDELTASQNTLIPPTAPPYLYYTVQVGAFSNSVNARNLTQKLIQKGFPAYLEEVNLNTGLSYRVRVGKLQGLKQAKELAVRLSREGYPTKICP